MVEVGTLMGKYAKKFIKYVKQRTTYIIYLEFRTNLPVTLILILKKEVILHKGDSGSILNSNFPDKYFVFIYIYGVHIYEGVNKDLLAFIKKSKMIQLLV